LTLETMTATGREWVRRLVCGLAIVLSSLTLQAESTRRLYVEPFATRTGPENLRENVITELRKQNSISLVAAESAADLILGGGGEIWIKGYRSLNPRSGQSHANATPVYSGYLSVELRGARGETLWSDLITPDPDSQDIAKDLSRIIAKHIAEALPRVSSTPSAPSAPVSSQPRMVLKGAGASFPAPVYSKWFTNYRREKPNLEITYESVGSEAGVRKLLAGEVDFGASDGPEAIRAIAPGEESKYLFFPSLAGAIVPIVNLPGVPENIAFTAEALAGIYLGKIKKWNDPVLRQANRSVHLPDLDIAVVHGSDGSGTSYAWTDFLSQTNPEWKTRVGAALAPGWPVGRAANGNEGAAKLVKELGGSIGYVELIYALQNHLSFGKVRNRNGEFVAADLRSIAIAAQRAATTDDLKFSIVNAPGAGAYPIATFTWLIVPEQIPDESRRRALSGFLKWMLGPGQRQAAALGYVALPKNLVARASAAIDRIRVLGTSEP
jgi:phosphate ABC transporter phosphate-binding protein